MKKIYLVISIFLLAVSLIGCFENPVDDQPIDQNPPNEDKLLTDKIAPLLSFVNASKQNVTINQYSEYDINEGLKALDNLEGDISHKIQADLGDFDINKPGTYEIVYYVLDTAGNISNQLIKVITVKEVFMLIEKYPVFNGAIPGEAKAPNKPNVFQGAFYHRVFSSRDKWVGMEGEFTIPMPDINRYQGSFNTSLNMDPFAKNLDNPSIYMGGNASLESDVGLSLKTVLVKNASGSNVISTGSYAFRPFWRYITYQNYDIGTYDRENGRYYAVSTASAESNKTKNMIGNWDYLDTQYYYLPGDRVRMILFSPKAGYLQLQIEVIEKSSLPYSVNVRKENGWKDPENFISPMFSSPGHGTSDVEFKRVNAIDQVSNEGKPVISTTSKVGEMIWHNTYLHRNINGVLYRVPLNLTRGNTISAPIKEHFTITDINPQTGGQSVTIHPIS